VPGRRRLREFPFAAAGRSINANLDQHTDRVFLSHTRFKSIGNPLNNNKIHQQRHLLPSSVRLGQTVWPRKPSPVAPRLPYTRTERWVGNQERNAEMSDARRPIRSLALVILLAVGVMAGCTNQDNPTAPVPTDEMMAADWTWEECPDWNEACERIGWELWWECPPDGDWKNPGEYNSCRNQTAKWYLKELKACFSDEERDALRECALAWTPGQEESPEVDRKSRFHNE
jgi:hypothetical protein